MEDGIWQELTEPQEFEVVPLEEGAIKGASYDEMIAFRKMYDDYQQDMSLARIDFTNANKKLGALRRAMANADKQPAELIGKLHDAKLIMDELDKTMNGFKSKNEVGERNDPGPGAGWTVSAGLSTTYGPTGTHKKALNRAVSALDKFKVDLAEMVDNVLPGLEAEVAKTGAPLIEGQEVGN
jgi:hypothetical protein